MNMADVERGAREFTKPNGKHRTTEAYSAHMRGDADEREYRDVDLRGAGKPRLIVPGQEQEPDRRGYHFGAMDSAKFAVADFRPTWLVRKLLVRGQPGVIGGPTKGMKTSIVVDLALSLATATPFLGTFPVSNPYRVLVASGESGPHTLQETARRVCSAKGVDLASVGRNCFWDSTLPQLADLCDLMELQRGLKENAIEVFFCDPLYLSLLSAGSGAQASNMFDMGPIFARVARTCLDVGTTPFLVHHFRQTRGQKNDREKDPPELGDLAFAGIQEFTRQWLLLGRREAYEAGTGLHRLWLAAGGSIGHGGLWALDVDEGQLAEDFSGRKWDVAVTLPAEARQAERETREQAKVQRKEAEAETDARQVLHAHTVNDPDNQGVVYTRLRESAGLSGARFGTAVTRLKAKGEIIETAGTAAVGNQAQRRARILWRRPSSASILEGTPP